MRNRLYACLVGMFLATILLACSTSPTTPTAGPGTMTPPGPGVSSCEAGLPVFSVVEAVSSSHPCRPWVWRLQGRVARSGNMSAVVWSLRTESTTGLIVSAVHTLGEGWLGPGGSAIPERLSDPSAELGATRIFLVGADGGEPDDLASVLFVLYHPEIPAAESGSNLRDVLPRHDFLVGVIDSQKVQVQPLPQAPGPLRHEPPKVFDPHDLTMSGATYGEAVAGETVILMGFPNAGELAGALVGSLGVVLDDEQAVDAVGALAAAGDAEGAIPYDAEAEMILSAEATTGMSGGGVFDRNGRLVGIMVRASEKHRGQQYVRAVRMTYVVSRLTTAFQALDQGQQAVLGPYLEVPISK